MRREQVVTFVQVNMKVMRSSACDWSADRIGSSICSVRLQCSAQCLIPPFFLRELVLFGAFGR